MIIIIAIFGILSILGTSMLAATTASYKLRIDDSNRMKNLYSAESGIDQSYIRMTKVVQDALNAGITAVSTAIENNANNLDNLGDINEIYRANVMKYIKENLVQKFDNEWKEVDVEGGKKAAIKCIATQVKDKNGNVVQEDETLYLNGKDTGETVTYGDRIITLQSTYKSPQTGKERIVSVDYNISVPDYYRIETSKGEKVSNIIKYSLAADGNLKIDESNSLRVDGDVWIKGNPSTGNQATEDLTEKYAGGIDVTDSNVIFTGDVNTAHNINIKDGQVSLNSNKTDTEGKILDTSIFAENVSLTSDLENKDSILQAEKANMYLANDLVIDSSDGKATIKNFYGFNDITSESNELELLNRRIATRGSSSIIINSNEWPNVNGSLDITDKAYIMGSAYIKTETPYQTGESVALKGNYKVYSTQAKDSLDKYQYEYINPLVLVTKNSEGKPLTIEEKAEYFADNSTDVDIRKSGIRLPAKTYSIGAYISKDVDDSGKVFNSTATLESQAMDAFKFKTDYVKAVYHMNDKEYTADNINYDINKDFLEGAAKKNVQNQINWAGVDFLVALRGNVIELDGITLVLNNGSEEINIYNTAISLGSKLLVQMQNNIKYIVLSKSNINFTSDRDYKGSLISMKDICINEVNKNNGTDITIGMTPLTTEELNSKFNIGVLDLVFTIGERTEGNLIIQAEKLISKEKWKLIK